MELTTSQNRASHLVRTWAGNTDDPKAMGFKADITPMSIERVERQVSGEAQFETFICKTGYEAQKYLGLLATDTVTYGETEERVGEQMQRLSDKAKAARNKAAGTAMIVLGVAVPKGNYPLKHISSSQDVLNAIWSPLEQVFTAGIGLPRTVNKHLKYSILKWLLGRLDMDRENCNASTPTKQTGPGRRNY